MTNRIYLVIRTNGYNIPIMFLFNSKGHKDSKSINKITGVTCKLATYEVFYEHNGMFHRTNGPAHITYSLNGEVIKKRYKLYGNEFQSKELWSKAVEALGL